MSMISEQVKRLRDKAHEIADTYGYQRESDVTDLLFEAANTIEMLSAKCADKLEKMTIADRIRSMTDQELAVFIEKCEDSDIDYGQTYCSSCGKTIKVDFECNDCRLWWLRMEYKDGEYWSRPVSEAD